MANKQTNELVTLSGIENSDLLLVYDSDEVGVERLKKVEYSNFKDELLKEDHMQYICDPDEVDQGVAGSGNSLKDLIDDIGTSKSATIYLCTLNVV